MEKYVRVFNKTELAQLYMPNAVPGTARKKLREWIEKNKNLHEELLETGYTSRSMLFTPRQVRIIFKHLGTP